MTETRTWTTSDPAVGERERSTGGSEREHVCPECDGALVTDEEHGETACSECGLVVETDSIDRGPEWRAFDPRDRDRKARVGAPTTTMLHDKGLSTTIDWRNKDAYGKTISSAQRRRMQRLRTWNRRFRTSDHQERNLRQALGEIDRMASALGLPETVRETASVIYRRALSEDLLPGRSIEGVATSALHAAARQAGLPRTIDEVARVSRVEKEEFRRTYRYVVRELALEVAPADPVSYVTRFASALGLSDEAERLARGLLDAAKERGLHSGKNPVGLAAAAVYAAPLLTDETVTQGEVSEVADISEVTIRNRYRELLRAYEEAETAPA
jgi:transcription initiation factor TFIIB